jgi:hypothetical protein
MQKVMEELGAVTRQRDIALTGYSHLQKHLTCVRTSPEHPLQRHGVSEICVLCYEALRSDYARAALVAGSIGSVVYAWMREGKGCPFCGAAKTHTKSCYLSFDAGQQLLEEYAAIEKHRDMLLADQTRVNGSSSHINGLTKRLSFKQHLRSYH